MTGLFTQHRSHISAQIWASVLSVYILRQNNYVYMNNSARQAFWTRICALGLHYIGLNWHCNILFFCNILYIAIWKNTQILHSNWERMNHSILIWGYSVGEHICIGNNKKIWIWLLWTLWEWFILLALNNLEKTLCILVLQEPPETSFSDSKLYLKS